MNKNSPKRTVKVYRKNPIGQYTRFPQNAHNRAKYEAYISMQNIFPFRCAANERDRVNLSPHEQNGDIFKCIFVNGKFCILIKI